MIKFTYARTDGKVGLGFGVSAENVKRLKDGQPIVVDCSEMGLEAVLMIFYGETEGDMIEQIQSFIGPDTTVHNPL